MRRSHIVLLTAVVSLGLLLALLSIIAGRSDPTLAAPEPLVSDQDLHQFIHCVGTAGDLQGFAQTGLDTIHTVAAIADGAIKSQGRAFTILDPNGVVGTCPDAAIVRVNTLSLAVHHARPQELPLGV